MRFSVDRLVRYATVAVVVAVAIVVLLLAAPRPRTPSAGATGTLALGSGAVTLESILTPPPLVSTPTASILAEPTPTVSPEPNVAVDDHDRFWGPFVEFGPPLFLPYGLTSLSGATDLADLVVTGSISDLYIGEQWVSSPDEPTQPLAYLKVEIDRVLKGEPESRTEGTVEVMFSLAYENDFETAAAGPMPTGEYLWLLIDASRQRDQKGLPPRDSDIAPFAYFIPNEVQGIVLNANGVAEVVLADRFEEVWGSERFPITVRGQDFGSLIEQVEEIVATSP